MDTSSRKSKYKHGQHPNSLANLTSHWQPGQAGNPRGQSLSQLLRQALEKPLEKPPENASARDRLVYSTLVGAIRRESTPYKEVWDRLEGKVVDHVELEARSTIIYQPAGLPPDVPPQGKAVPPDEPGGDSEPVAEGKIP